MEHLAHIAIEDLARRLPSEQRTTRFAPSPTGYLHMGHVVHALYVWGLAEALGARIVLRLEDHDQERCRSHYADSILADLEWLGLLSDLSGVKTGKTSALFTRQSHHWERYAAAIAQLQDRGLVYACQCSRKDIKQMSRPSPEHPSAQDPLGRPEISSCLERPGGRSQLLGTTNSGAIAGEPRGDAGLGPTYAGTCRVLGLAHSAASSLRFRLPEGGKAEFWDYWRGDLQVPAAQAGGDFVIQDRRNQFTYQLAVVVDDLSDGVNLVIRGADIFPSTAAQELLRQSLGATTAIAYAHHPLLWLDRQRAIKLSKRDQAASIGSMRAAGLSPGRLMGQAAAALGLLRDGQSIRLRDLASIVTDEKKQL